MVMNHLIISLIITFFGTTRASSPPAHTPPTDFNAEKWYPRNLPTVHPPWRDAQGRTLFPLPPLTTQPQGPPTTFPSVTPPETTFFPSTIVPTTFTKSTFDVVNATEDTQLTANQHESTSPESTVFNQNTTKTATAMQDSQLFTSDTPTSHFLFQTTSSGSSFHTTRKFHFTAFPSTTPTSFQMTLLNGRVQSTKATGSTTASSVNPIAQVTFSSTSNGRDFSTTTGSTDDFFARTTRSIDTFDASASSTLPSTVVFTQPTPSDIHSLPSSLPTSSRDLFESTPLSGDSTVFSSSTFPSTLSFTKSSLPDVSSLPSSKIDLIESTTTNDDSTEDALLSTDESLLTNVATVTTNFETKTANESVQENMPSTSHCAPNLLFILDASGSVPQVYENQKAVVKTISSAVNKENKKNIAVIIYSSKLRKRLAIDFNHNRSEEEFDKQVDDLPFLAGVTSTGTAIAFASSMLQTMEKPIDIVLITDGFSFDSTSQSAKTLRKVSGDRVYIAGTYATIVRKELVAITGNEEKVFIGRKAVSRLAEKLTCSP